jgi:hypothetical protein
MAEKRNEVENSTKTTITIFSLSFNLDNPLFFSRICNERRTNIILKGFSTALPRNEARPE